MVVFVRRKKSVIFGCEKVSVCVCGDWWSVGGLSIE